VTPGQQTILRWRRNPIDFVAENFGAVLDEWQRDALTALAGLNPGRRRLCLKACTGPGKTFVLAAIGWWRLACFADRGEHPKGAALSITADNLKDNLWPEMSKLQTKSEFLRAAFTWTKERIYANDHPETWFLSARSFAKDADAEAIGRALSGLHSKYPFVLLDETGDMPTAVGRAAEQIFTGSPVDAAIIQAGNPTSTEGLLYHAATQGAGQWHVVTITADPDDPKRTPRVDIELAREQIKQWGRDNPWVMATILGQFPPGGFNTLLTLTEVEAAMGRHRPEHEWNFAQKRVGVDVALQGDDRTVIIGRQGKRATKTVVMRNAKPSEIAARVIQSKQRFEQELTFVDASGGWGSGVVDAMTLAGHAPVEVQFAGKAQDSRYFNARSEMWFRMAEWVKAGGCLPPDRDWARELTAPTYTLQGGKFRLEEKAQIKKRLGFSPDLADALACTFYLEDMPAAKKDDLGRPILGAQGPQMLPEHEPFN